MKNLSVLFVAALSVTALGCKKSNSGAIDKLTAFKETACACKDAACAKKAAEDMNAWAQEFAKSKDGDNAMSPDDEKKIGEISEAMMKCISKATETSGAGGDTPPPPPEKAPDEGSAAPK
jgi:hypothetical protein